MNPSKKNLLSRFRVDNIKTAAVFYTNRTMRTKMNLKKELEKKKIKAVFLRQP